MPSLLEVLGDIDRKRLIDIGCGSGAYCREMARKGAVVTGVDRSKNQIDAAVLQEQNDDLGITYLNSDIDFAELTDGSFDFALMIYVILDLPRPEDVISILKRAHSLLRKNGLLVLADVHPHNMNRPNEIENFQGKLGAGYFDNGAKSRSEARLANGELTVFDPNYHYRLDFLVNSLIASGLALERLLEPQFRAVFPTHILLGARRAR